MTPIKKGAHVRLKRAALDARKQVLAPAGASGRVVAILLRPHTDDVAGYALEMDNLLYGNVTVDHFDVRELA